MLTRRRPPTHPGLILKEHYLVPRNVKIQDFADATGISRKHLSQVINGHAGISADTALKFAEALGTTPQLWINLQVAVDLYNARKRREENPTTVRTFPAPEPRPRLT